MKESRLDKYDENVKPTKTKKKKTVKKTIKKSIKKTTKKGEKKTRKYGVDKGERGFYDVRNPLNDLTGKEWTYFTNSVLESDFLNSEEDLELVKYLQDSIIVSNFPVSGEEGYAHKIRKQHPTPKPPQLMRELIKFFTKENQLILDPFMGVGGTLLGASLCNRRAVGIDLEQNYIELYKQANENLGLTVQQTIVGDSRDLLKIDELKDTIIDAIITDPPYANMMTKKKTGGDKTKKTGVSTPFSDLKSDLGNLRYQEFLAELQSIIKSASKKLKTKGYVIIFTKDLQPSKDHHNLLHADIVTSIREIDGLIFKGYKIWYDKNLNLYPYGYPFSFVANQLHQYILIFRKENN